MIKNRPTFWASPMAELASNESSKEMLDLKVKLREDTKTSAL